LAILLPSFFDLTYLLFNLSLLDCNDDTKGLYLNIYLFLFIFLRLLKIVWGNGQKEAINNATRSEGIR